MISTTKQDNERTSDTSKSVKKTGCPIQQPGRNNSPGSVLHERLKAASGHKDQSPKPAEQGDNLSVLKRIITGAIEYAEGRNNVHGPIKTSLANALEELEKIEGNSMCLLKVPELRLGGNSLLPRTSSQESLTSVASARSTGTNSSTQQMTEYRQYRQEAIKARKEEEEHITKLEKEVDDLIGDCQATPSDIKGIAERAQKLKVFVTQLKEMHEEGDDKDRGYENGVEYYESWHEVREKARRRAQGQLIKDAVLSSAGVKRPRRSPSSSPEEKASGGKQGRKKQRREKATVNGENPMSGPTHNAPQSAEKVRPKKSKQLEGLLVKVGQDKTYAQVLEKLRKEVNPDTSGTTVLGVKQTRSGDIFLKLERGSGREAFTAEVEKAVQGLGEVRKEERKWTLEIRDIDSEATVDEVRTALERALGNQDNGRKVTLLKPNMSGLRMAIVMISKRQADELIRIGHVRVGLVSCRIRKRVKVVRCHRCLGFGHRKDECKHADRSNLCFKCGGADHRLAQCQAEPSCFLCKEAGTEEDGCKHMAGSGSCSVFRRALDTAKKKARGN